MPAVTPEASSGSLATAVTTVSRGTPVAPGAGVTASMAGEVVSAGTKTTSAQ